VRQVSAGEYHTMALTTEGLYMWGDGAAGQLGLDCEGHIEDFRVCDPTTVVGVQVT